MHNFRFLQLYLSEVQEHLISQKCFILSMSFDGPHAVVLLSASPDEEQYAHMNEEYGFERVE